MQREQGIACELMFGKLGVTVIQRDNLNDTNILSGKVRCNRGATAEPSDTGKEGSIVPAQLRRRLPRRARARLRP